ncbi:MAG TPA: oligoendopeptidase F, partial [Stellaceae bacterium]|nr:oligoendopeptidase F [Stellaceae bacterium]
MAAQRSTAKRKGPALGRLPEWDLNDLYPGPDSAELKRDLAEADSSAQRFQAAHAGKLAAISGAELGAAVREFERIQELLGRVLSYASLRYADDQSDPENGRFFQNMQEKATDISTRLLFFTLELNRVDDKALDDKLRAPELAHYRPWLRDLRAFRPYQLSDELEKLLHEKAVAGRAAWTRLFDETNAALRFPVKGKRLTGAEALHLLSEPSGATRKAAAKSIGKVFGDNAS